MCYVDTILYFPTMKGEIIMFAQIATIDGPPASGKTTMAQLLSREFDLVHLDSGAIFRAFTLYCMEENVEMTSPETIISVLPNFNISFVQEKVFIDGKDVTSTIRDPMVTSSTRYVSFIPEIRNFVSDLLLSYGKRGKVVCDGRNVGSEVFPDAKVKFYLRASLIERTLRRYNQILRSNPSAHFKEVYIALKEREEYEREKRILLMPKNAIIIDNTNLSIEDTLEVMKTYMTD